MAAIELTEKAQRVADLETAKYAIELAASKASIPGLAQAKRAVEAQLRFARADLEEAKRP